MMFRRDKWWVREIERINRAHAEERADLIAAIAHLSGRPLPDRGWQRDHDTFEPIHPGRSLADPDQLP